jgi:hypothetical protein
MLRSNPKVSDAQIRHRGQLRRWAREVEENMRPLTACTMRRAVPAAMIGVWIALGAPASSACANVITDWDEKAIAAVTPMSGQRHQSIPAQRMMGLVHAAIRRGQLDRAALPALSGATTCGADHV